MPVYSNDKIKPRLQGQVAILVAEYLETKRVVTGAILIVLDGLAVKPSDKPIERTEHVSRERKHPSDCQQKKKRLRYSSS